MSFLRYPKEHDVRGSHTVYVSQAKEALVESEEQEGDTDVETALFWQRGDTGKPGLWLYYLFVCGAWRSATLVVEGIFKILWLPH